MTTDVLCDALIKYTKAMSTESRRQKYKRYLVLLVNYNIKVIIQYCFTYVQCKYARETSSVRDDHFFSAFKEWANQQDGHPSDSEWERLLQEDREYNYNPDKDMPEGGNLVEENDDIIQELAIF